MNSLVSEADLELLPLSPSTGIIGMWYHAGLQLQPGFMMTLGVLSPRERITETRSRRMVKFHVLKTPEVSISKIRSKP